MQNFERFQCSEGLLPGPQQQDPCHVVPDLPVSSPDIGPATQTTQTLLAPPELEAT